MNLPYLLSGLLLVCMFIIYDTQLIVERAERGIKDVPSDTLKLFMDLFELFIKILRILMEMKDNEDRKKRRN